jgi:hypothetical protein
MVCPVSSAVNYKPLLHSYHCKRSPKRMLRSPYEPTIRMKLAAVTFWLVGLLEAPPGPQKCDVFGRL